MLRLLSSKIQGHKDFGKSSKPCHVGIHWIFLAGYSDEYPCGRVSVSFHFLHNFLMVKLATSCLLVLPLRVGGWCCRLGELGSDIHLPLKISNPEKVRYKVIGVEMKGMESSMKLVALGATQRRG